MTTHPQRTAGFSLVEVVLAVGIVGFSILSVFSLFSVSIQTNAATVEQVEALSAVKGLSAYLQSVPDGNSPPNQGFVPIYGWMSNASNPTPASNPPLLYAFNNPTTTGTIGLPGVSTITDVGVPADSSKKTAATQKAAQRQGRLYGIYLSVSPNSPIGSTAYPTSATLATYNPGTSSASAYPEGALALQVKVYTVPQVGVVPPTGASPVLTYDLTLPR